jgi:uncharacterized protein (DUF433 family)
MDQPAQWPDRETDSRAFIEERNHAEKTTRNGRAKFGSKSDFPSDEPQANSLWPKSPEFGRASTEPYTRFSRHVRCFLRPKGRVERMLVEHVARSLWNLCEGTRPDAEIRNLAAAGALETLERWRRLRSQLLRRSRRQTRARLFQPGTGQHVEPRPLSVPYHFEGLGFESVRPLNYASPRQADQRRTHGRLTIDPKVSTRSPVVKGTRLTTRLIVSLVVDGWTWNDILMKYPELTNEDVHACVAYEVEVGAADANGL